MPATRSSPVARNTHIVAMATSAVVGLARAGVGDDGADAEYDGVGDDLRTTECGGHRSHDGRVHVAAHPTASNTRLASRSSASMVVSADRSTRGSGWSTSRLACRSRARSTALRTLRALANQGLPMRWPR